MAYPKMRKIGFTAFEAVDVRTLCDISGDRDDDSDDRVLEDVDPFSLDRVNDKSLRRQ